MQANKIVTKTSTNLRKSAILAPVASPGSASHGARSQTRPKKLRHLLGRHRDEISESISNLLKLDRCLRKPGKTQPRQMLPYDPGIGTLTTLVNGASRALTVH
ncbi:hypothetical protein [Bradyrhizobium sp. BR 1432]|uniref:hypothetical protein n=1 Tax=Bradyrhizobium sp. BR 1432 TaxID=3447966 RepID=UPI003EE6F8B4